MQVKFKNIIRELPADAQTPVAMYLKIRDLYPQSALLEGMDYNAMQNSRSIIGICPISSFMVSRGKVTKVYPGGITEQEDAHDVPTQLEQYVDSLQVEDRTLRNGLLGFTSYDAIHYFEPTVPITDTERCFDAVPDMCYIFYRYFIVISHYTSTMTIVENLPEGETSGIDAIITRLGNTDYATYNFEPVGELESPITDEQYKAMVCRGIEHTKRGDVFQIVLSRRFSQAFKGDEFNLYRALRSVNPSPYLFFFDFGSYKIFGSSPETHLMVDDGKAYIDPIAGTFRRTGDFKKDQELAKALLNDEKENAEHIMLVDLARNDLGRGGRNVKIEFLRQIHFYSHVIHMVSRVSADIDDKVNIFRLFGNTFPAGTLSGAPKVRAMQLIDEIEGHNRKAYGGCIGYIGFDLSLKMAITIRSFVSIDNRLYLQAGAGIVAHSNPASECQEINNKLGALFAAAKTATKFNPNK